MASKEDPDAVVWRVTRLCQRSDLLILETPVGHDDFVKEQLRSRREKHDVLLQRIPAVPNLQAAWLLLTFCVAARANFTLRAVRPALVEEFAASHNYAIWTCLVKILGIDCSAVSEAAKKAVTLPLSTGGLGIQNATRALPAARWASWADALEMIRKRHPGATEEILKATALRQSQLSGLPRSGWKRQVSRCQVGSGPNRPDCGHSGKPRMAPASTSGVGEEQSRRIAPPTHGTRTDVVPRRPHGSRTVLQFPNE